MDKIDSGLFSSKMEEMKEEWEDMMESRKKMEEIMKDMPTEGMEEMMTEWDKMTQSMDKLQEMMEQKQSSMAA